MDSKTSAVSMNIGTDVRTVELKRLESQGKRELDLQELVDLGTGNSMLYRSEKDPHLIVKRPTSSQGWRKELRFYDSDFLGELAILRYIEAPHLVGFKLHDRAKDDVRPSTDLVMTKLQMDLYDWASRSDAGSGNKSVSESESESELTTNSVAAKPTACHSLTALQSICQQLVERVAQLHDLGILHRDIKPHNVMIDLVEGHETRPQVTLIDYGNSIGPVSPGAASKSEYVPACAPDYTPPECHAEPGDSAATSAGDGKDSKQPSRMRRCGCPESSGKRGLVSYTPPSETWCIGKTVLDVLAYTFGIDMAASITPFIDPDTGAFLSKTDHHYWTAHYWADPFTVVYPIVSRVAARCSSCCTTHSTLKDDLVNFFMSTMARDPGKRATCRQLLKTAPFLRQTAALEMPATKLPQYLVSRSYPTWTVNDTKTAAHVDRLHLYNKSLRTADSWSASERSAYKFVNRRIGGLVRELSYACSLNACRMLYRLVTRTCDAKVAFGTDPFDKCDFGAMIACCWISLLIVGNIGTTDDALALGFDIYATEQQAKLSLAGKPGLIPSHTDLCETSTALFFDWINSNTKAVVDALDGQLLYLGGGGSSAPPLTPLGGTRVPLTRGGLHPP